MNNKKSTKRALVSSVLSLVLCMTMLIGTTFAWFTDSVTSTNNIIKSGNLDVELEYSTDMSSWNKVTETTNIFKEGALWEPGYTEVVYLRVSNLGSLALKYNLGVNVASETAGTNKAGESFKLSNYIEFGVIDPISAAFSGREAARAAVTDAKKLSAGYTKEGSLLAKAEDASEYPSNVVAMVVYMPETVGNEANHNGNAPEIKLGLNLFATQFTAEMDSFNNQYDKAAPWTGAVVEPEYKDGAYLIGSAEELAWFVQLWNSDITTYSNQTKNAVLTADIDLNNLPWTSINKFTGSFDGQGYTIYNLKVVGEQSVGFFKEIGGATIKNVTFENANITGHHWVGVIFGWEGAESRQSYITNCNIINSNVSATTINNDDGDKVGGIGGYACTTTITECSVKNTTIAAYRDGGGVLGYAQPNVIVKDNEVSGLTLTWNNEVNYKNYTSVEEADLNAVVGESAGATVEDNTESAPVIEVPVSTTEAAQAALDNAKPGDVIVLAAGNYGTLTVKKFWTGDYQTTGVTPITIKSTSGAVVAAVDLNGMNYVTLENITFDAAKAIEVYTNSGASGDFGNVVDSANEVSQNYGANHITVKNCTFTGTPSVDISKYCPINFMGSNISSWTYDIVVSSCKFFTNAQNFIRMNNVTNNGSVLIENNVFGGQEYTTNHHAINASANGGDWTIKGNTFINWNPKKCAFATGRSTAEGITDFVITGNTFSNTRIPTAENGDDGVIEIKTNSYSTTNYTLDFSGNTFADALAGLDETTVKYVKP